MESCFNREFVTYKFGFVTAGKTYGFKQKNLFCLSDSPPRYINIKEHSGSKGWWIDSEWVSFKKAKEILTEINHEVEITMFDFATQCEVKFGMEPHQTSIVESKKKLRRVPYTEMNRHQLKDLIKEIRKKEIT